MSARKVKVRFAPSPTGDLHVGNIRTALFDWAFARHTGGTFLFRIEDTDTTRVTPEYIQAAIDTLKWLGLDWDEGPEVGGPNGPYLQSQRLDIYAKWAATFLENKDAYHCYCSPDELEAVREEQRKANEAPGYNGHCRELTADQIAQFKAQGREAVVRMRMPDGSTTFTDAIRGDVTFEHKFVPDFVLVRADGSPLYTLAVAVDDVTMEVTHVLRGEDLLSSTPRQIRVYQAMGVKLEDYPTFAHLPFVMGTDNAKLSKRNGEASIAWYREQGYLPEAICNYLALLGWSHGGSTVLRSTDTNRQEVALRKIQPSVAIAFYPGCSDSLKYNYRPHVPLIMMLAELDDWTPPEPCIQLAKKTGADFYVYPDSYHNFDNPVGNVRLRTDVPNGVNPGKGVHVGRNTQTGPQAWAQLLTTLRTRWQ